MEGKAGKKRLIMLMQLLCRQTDEEHPFSTSDIIEYFAVQGIATDRKTVKAVVELLIEASDDVITTRGKQNQYFIGARDFEVPEIVFENPEPQKCDQYSIDVTLVTLWENSKCRNILTKYVPQLADEKTRKPAMGISIQTIAQFTPDIFSDGVLDKIDDELREV